MTDLTWHRRGVAGVLTSSDGRFKIVGPVGSFYTLLDHGDDAGRARRQARAKAMAEMIRAREQ